MNDAPLVPGMAPGGGAPPLVDTAGNLLTVRDLKIAFDLDTGTLEAVRGISFRVQHGKTVALVGESGSGKSVVAQAILGILPKIARISQGQILFDRSGKIDAARTEARKAVRLVSMMDATGRRVYLTLFAKVFEQLGDSDYVAITKAMQSNLGD